MKITEFENDEAYIEAQKRTLEKKGTGPFFNDQEIRKIADWMKRNGMRPKRGVCHGARGGHEADEFKVHFPRCDVFGTDLVPFSGRSRTYQATSKVVEWDFRKQNPEWVGAFDFVYTNSLDHTDDPRGTLAVWLEQLNGDGALFVQWVRNRDWTKGGDCFGAPLQEVMDLADEVGRLVDLLYTNVVPMKGNILRWKMSKSTVLVIEPKGEA